MDYFCFITYWSHSRSRSRSFSRSCYRSSNTVLYNKKSMSFKVKATHILSFCFPPYMGVANCCATTEINFLSAFGDSEPHFELKH